MEKDRQTKIIAIVALFIGVATLTLGFATFSAKLIIQSKATVTPDADSFKVVLSKEQNAEIVGKITPTGNGDEATISNTVDPTISGLNAKFVNPGEKVVYEFYAVNTGELDAFLNKIDFANIAGKNENKVCTAGEGTTDSYVQSACNSIRVTVKVGEDDKACQTSTYGAHKLEKKTGEKVVVTIEYDKSGTRADGPFSVEFGDITLNYSTTDSETKNVPSCVAYDTQVVVDPFKVAGKTNVDDANSDGKISLSDKVTLGTETFYVMSTDETSGTVTMFAEWNLNVGTNTVSGTSGMQNEACKGLVVGFSESERKCVIDFSSTNYWSSVSTYPAWVYNEQSNLYTYVENYVTELKKLGYNSVTGRLINHEELLTLGCSAADNTCNNGAPEWVKNTSYWTGSADTPADLWYVKSNGYFNLSAYYESTYTGVRPVITIKASEI